MSLILMANSMLGGIKEVKMEEIITVRCYYKEEKLTKTDAYKKYREAYECSDGSEKERYMEVLMDLADGKDYCDDKVY